MALFQPGQSGNPGGRPKGARCRLSESFLTKMLKDFEEHGEAAIIKTREEKPDQYLRVIASILPKEFTGEDGDVVGVMFVERRVIDPKPAE